VLCRKNNDNNNGVNKIFKWSKHNSCRCWLNMKMKIWKMTEKLTKSPERDIYPTFTTFFKRIYSLFHPIQSPLYLFLMIASEPSFVYQLTLCSQPTTAKKNNNDDHVSTFDKLGCQVEPKFQFQVDTRAAHSSTESSESATRRWSLKP